VGGGGGPGRETLISTDKIPWGGWAIRVVAPVAAGREVYGVLILATNLNHNFARKIAKATNTSIFLTTMTKVLASSQPPEQGLQVDFDKVQQSLLEKRSIFQNDYQTQRSVMYTPLKVVDEILCLVISSDTSGISGLLRQKRTQLLTSFLVILMATVVLGASLTFAITKPMRRLQTRAQEVIKEFSPKDLPIQPRGNEIHTLTQAFDLMLAVIKKHIEELREAERFQASIFASIKDGISIIGPDLTIIQVNPTLENWFAHYSSLIGQKCYQVYRGREEPCDPCPVQRTFQTGKSDYEIMTRADKDGEFNDWVEIYTFPMKDPVSGKLTGVIEYVREITERRRTEEALKEKEEQLRQAQKMEAIGRLAGGVAHDFNNILTAVSGYSELLLMQLPPESQEHLEVQEIHKAAARAASLTRQLLAFSRKQVIQPRPLNLNEAISSLEGMLRRLIGEDIDLAVSPGEGLGLVLADAGQMEQVIVNLALNARDAMPRGGKLTLETANVDLDSSYARTHLDVEPGPYVMLAVSDSGQGMDAEVRSRIFEPFFTTKELGKGTGLGLSMIYGIVKQNRGHIWVYSEPGQGTTFKIYLPRMQQPVEADGLHLRPAVLAGGRETVLLVEDDEVVRRVVGKMLQRQGYQVLEVADGREALETSDTHPEPIHLILTDVVMPGMSGPELAVRVTQKYPEIKVLFMSGHTENTIVQHGVLEPGVDFIQKPFKYDDLMRRVREVLDRPGAVAPGRPSEKPKTEN